MTPEMKNFISETIRDNRIVLFMKGSKRAPMCGYSGYVCQVLNKLGVDFVDIDVLANPELREAVKVYSAWPTLPQLYINHEFVGGADIVKDLYESKELEKLLADS